MQLIDAHGRSLCNYRKTHLFGDLDHSMFSAGADHFPLVELNGWKLGFLICYDIEFPENARRLALAGAELILVPTANMTPYDFVCRGDRAGRALENQCYLAYANYCGPEDQIQYCGQSSIMPPGWQPAGHGRAGRSLIWRTWTMRQVNAGREASRYLTDRRPELYVKALGKR